MADDQSGIQYRQMTTEEVLNVFVEEHRCACQHGEADERVALNLDTTIKEWRRAIWDDWYSWRHLGQSLNVLFGTKFRRRQWSHVLPAKKGNTLRRVCELIASEALVPHPEPMVCLGSSCPAAGAFRTLRHLLAKVGADVGNLRPSSLLKEYEREGLPQSYLEIVKLAPWLLSKLKPSYRNHDRYLLPIGAVLFIMAISGGIASFVRPLMGTVICGAALLSLIGVWRVSETVAFRPPVGVAFSGLSDFRELSYGMLSDEERRSNVGGTVR